MKKISSKSGQSMLEYAVVIAVVVAAMLAMFSLVRRHIQSNWRESADSLGEGRQYQSGVTTVINY